MTMLNSEVEHSIREDLVELWKALGSSGAVKDLKQAKTQIRSGDRFVGVGVDVLGARHLLIPLAQGAEAKGIWKAGAIVVDRRNLVGADEQPGTWLVISCLNPELNDVFVRLAANIASDLPADASSIVSSCISVLESWRELLGPATGRGLSAQTALGLLGELLILLELGRHDPARALKAWTGPLGGRHDFRWGTNAIEGKATRTRVGRFITINGPQQLEPPKLGNLHLSWVRLERVPGGAISLNAVVSQLKTLGLDNKALDDVLLRLDANDPTDPEMNATYEISERLMWQVNSNFPKITPQSFIGGQVPASVVDMTYVIDCSATPPKPLAEAETHNFWLHFLD